LQTTLKLEAATDLETSQQSTPEDVPADSEGCQEGSPATEEALSPHDCVQDGLSTPEQPPRSVKPSTGGKITKKTWDRQRPIWNEAHRPDISWGQLWPATAMANSCPGRATAASFSYADAGGTTEAGRSCVLTLKSICGRVKPGDEGVKPAGSNFEITVDPLVDTVYDVMVAIERSRSIPKENIILYGPKLGFSLQPRVPLMESGLFWRQDGKITTCKKPEDRFFFWKLGQTFY